jgi:hypothetical protein
MHGKVTLGKKEIPASHVYDYADSNGFLPLPKIHTLGYSFDLSNYTTLLAGKLKGFAYSEGEVGRLWLSFPGLLPVVFTIGSFCEA